jgi:hypothetical protein
MPMERLSVPLYHLSGLDWQTQGGDFDYNSGDFRLAVGRASSRNSGPEFRVISGRKVFQPSVPP